MGRRGPERVRVRPGEELEEGIRSLGDGRRAEGGERGRQKPRRWGWQGPARTANGLVGGLPHSEEIGGLDGVYGVLSLGGGPGRGNGARQRALSAWARQSGAGA